MQIFGGPLFKFSRLYFICEARDELCRELVRKLNLIFHEILILIFTIEVSVG